MKATIFSILISLGLIFGAIFLSTQVSDKNDEQSVQNVSIVSGVQIIDLTAKGGYSPRKSVAKAGVPTVLRVNTDGTFDCSAVVRVPSMNITKNLPQSGVTEIDLGTSTAGVLQGTCGMGMYPFEIDFQN